MDIRKCFSPEQLIARAKALFKEERAIDRLEGWFLVKEICLDTEKEFGDEPNVVRKAKCLQRVCERLPLSLSDNAVFAGTQRDAFARSYALINPNFKVSTFNGYCDPTAVFSDIDPSDEIPRERIERVREEMKATPFVTKLTAAYDAAETDTREVIYFFEQVTGHLIPNFDEALEKGVEPLLARLDKKIENEKDAEKLASFRAMRLSLEAVLTLAERYAALAQEKAKCADGVQKQAFELLARTLKKVPRHGANGLYEAIQSFLLLWQTMCLEQAPNPFAFSVGNADRIFEPYRAADDMSREYAAALFTHFLTFFNVGDRSWAISQNVIVGGMDENGNDLTVPTGYALFDAYYEMNLPQPILSVKLHKNTPDEFYAEMGRFFFTPGCLTPSVFVDEGVFAALRKAGRDESDLKNYAIAGCQEPLIRGKDNGNTTNSWLNMAKVLELTLTGGVSLLSGERIGRSYAEMGARGADDVIKDIRKYFYANLDYYADRMVRSANAASVALSELPIPFLSAFMGGIESGYDVRDVKHQGTKYNGSGCLIHGLSVVADSFVAIDDYLASGGDADTLIAALKNNFEGYEDLRKRLSASEKFGNGLDRVDSEAATIASAVSDLIESKKNYLGNPFRPDWSSPSTHLIYGYQVGATPDGRKSREMLGYGVDPLFGEAQNGLGFRVMSAYRLPYDKFNGGYASHLGLDPKYFRGENFSEKGLEFKRKIFDPLFFGGTATPFYAYFNITTPDTLRKVLADPKKYAPSGVYIMRIHGTFVNFLDLSPEIQQDIITRLDPASTAAC